MSRCAWTCGSPRCLWSLEGILSCEACVSTKVIALVRLAVVLLLAVVLSTGGPVPRGPLSGCLMLGVEGRLAFRSCALSVEGLASPRGVGP